MSLDADDHASAHSSACREATDWLIRLREADGTEIYAAFEDWVTASPVNARAWAEVGYVSHLIEAAKARPTPPAPTPARRRRADRGPRPGEPAPLRRSLLAALAASAAVLFLAVATPEAVLRMQSDYVTGAEELREFALPDGGAVTLAPRTVVAIDYSDQERRIRLLRGDAYFEVAPNPTRPFRVLSEHVDTVVLGTGFEVRSGRDDAMVGVRHGRVRAQTRQGAVRTLTAGDGIRTGPEGAIEPFTTDPDNIAAWTDRRLIVEGRPAVEVVEALRPWYGGLILARGPRLKTARVTGVYDLADPVGALVALSRANGASVQRISPWIMVISFP